MPASNRVGFMPHLGIWELFGRSVLNANNFYWRLSYGLRTAYAIESSARPAYDKPEHSLCA